MDYAAASFDKASQRSSTEVEGGSTEVEGGSTVPTSPLRLGAGTLDTTGNLRQGGVFSGRSSFGWNTGGVSRFRGGDGVRVGTVTGEKSRGGGGGSTGGGTKPINIDQVRYMMEKLRMAG